MFVGGDFGFVGESYTAAMTLQDAQESINYYLEHDPTQGAKMPNALLATPGLNFITFTQLSPVRAMWVLPGNTQALIVGGSGLYLMKVVTPATATSIPTFSVTYVGTLLTNSGPVCMRDNGVLENGLGGYCLIVDGLNAYYYLLSGAPYSVSFTGALTFASAVITLPGALPNGLIIASGGSLSDSGGGLSGYVNIVSVDINALTVTMNKVSNANVPVDTITLNIPTFGRITDTGFLGAQRIAFIEGWLILNQPGSRTFYTTGPTPYQMLFPGSFFALKDSSTDNLVTLESQNRELWLFGERTSEVWYNSGNQNGPFERIPGVGPQIGCSAVNSIARCGQQLVWLARNEQGQNIIAGTAQYSWERLSTHAIENLISGYPVISDAFAYGYEDEGHLFYVLTFPTADMTLVYDFTSKAWHKRLWWDNKAGVYHRHRSNCYMDFADVRLVGDFQTGDIWHMSRDYQIDGDWPLRSLRRTPHVWNKESRERVFSSQLQIEFAPGVGTQTGQGVDPQAMLRWSNDGGFTWSTEHWKGIGKAGQTKNRAIWRALGQARDRVWEVVVTDPVPRDIVGATLYAEGS